MRRSVAMFGIESIPIFCCIRVRLGQNSEPNISNWLKMYHIFYLFPLHLRYINLQSHSSTTLSIFGILEIVLSRWRQKLKIFWFFWFFVFPITSLQVFDISTIIKFKFNVCVLANKPNKQFLFIISKCQPVYINSQSNYVCEG